MSEGVERSSRPSDEGAKQGSTPLLYSLSTTASEEFETCGWRSGDAPGCLWIYQEELNEKRCSYEARQIGDRELQCPGAFSRVRPRKLNWRKDRRLAEVNFHWDTVNNLPRLRRA